MTDNNCGATNRNGEACGLPAGWGTDHPGEGRCKHHGGATEGAGAPEGQANGNADHLAFSRVLEDDLEPDEQDLINGFVDMVADGSTDELIARVAGLALVKYVRSGDPRHAAEFRRQLETFNIVENAKELSIDGLIADFTTNE